MKSEKIGWHVIDRGARRMELFRDHEDFNQFITFMKYSLPASDALLWAFALMNNHYHMVLYASSDELTACMQRLNRLYSKYHNRKYSLVGHAFDGPYRAFRQGSPLLLLRCIAYVFMNPVNAFLVKDPKEYLWSCCRQFFGLEGSPMRADLGSLMESLGTDKETAWSWFHRAMDREARRRKRVFPDGLTMTALHAQQFEWLLDVAKERQDHLGGIPPEQVAMHWARQQGVVPRAMSKVLGVSSRVISDHLYKLKSRLEAEPELQLLLAPP